MWRAARFIGASLLFTGVVSCASPLVKSLALVTSSIMSVACSASPLIMSEVSLSMSVVCSAAYNFGASLLTEGIVVTKEAAISSFLGIYKFPIFSDETSKSSFLQKSLFPLLFLSQVVPKSLSRSSISCRFSNIETF